MYDPHHCSFRMLTLLRVAPENQLPIPKLSFLDLYLLFPHYLRELKMPSEAVERKRNLRLPRKKDSFVYLPDLRLVYRELQQYQRIAIERLVARDIFSMDGYSNRKAVLKFDSIPAPLIKKIDENVFEKGDLLAFLIKDVGAMAIDGPDSLLRQTNLELGGRLS